MPFNVLSKKLIDYITALCYAANTAISLSASQPLFHQILNGNKELILDLTEIIIAKSQENQEPGDVNAQQ